MKSIAVIGANDISHINVLTCILNITAFVLGGGSNISCSCGKNSISTCEDVLFLSQLRDLFFKLFNKNVTSSKEVRVGKHLPEATKL